MHLSNCYCEIQNTKTMKYIFFFLLIFLATQETFPQEQLPIIDMHLHVSNWWQENRLCFPHPCEQVKTQSEDRSELMPRTINEMKKFNIVMGALSGDNLEEVYEWGEAYSGFLTCPTIGEPLNADLDRIEEDIKSGKIKILGEVYSQYLNYSMNDPALDPIFSLAEKHDIPVLVHSAGLGGTPDFPVMKGDPTSISEVIRRHPKIRIYVENAGWPFLEEMTSLMYVYPNVYADLSTITWIIPRKTFYRYLKGLIDAGLEKRLMFGSDQMIWPETIELAIGAINSADFLTEEQKRDIFYNNAARFLRLSNQQISKHHEK